MNIKKFLFIPVLLVLIISQSGCGKEEPISKTEFFLDTECTITIYSSDEKKANEVISQAFDLVSSYQSMFTKEAENLSVYKNPLEFDSDVININKGNGQPVSVSEETKKLISLGIELGKASNGMFDISVGGLTDLWDFKAEVPLVPSASDIKQALSAIDYGNLKVSGTKVTLKNPDASLDLGGIAKGYIGDMVSIFLKEEGVNNALINLGGNVIALGEKTDSSPWVIGVERPYSDRKEIVGTVAIKNQTVTTSGVYERHFQKDGREYHHVIDPTTGYPVETDLAAAVVIGPDENSAMADGLSTVCLLLGKDKSIEFIKNFPDFQFVLITSADEILDFTKDGLFQKQEKE